MKTNTATILTSILVIFLMLSCQDDSLDESTERFILNSQLTTSSELGAFIFVTNQDGEVLFSETGLDLEKSIELNIPIGDKIDLTYGVDHLHNPQIKTFRDIASGFTFPKHFFSCSSSNFAQFSNSTFQKSITVEITGMSSYEEIYLPFDQLISPVFDTEKNTTTFKGFSFSDESVLITVKEENEDYKSFLLKDDGWTELEGYEYERSISIDDFVPTQLHEIETGISDEWKSNCKVITTDNQIINLYHEDITYLDNPVSAKLKLFTLPEFEIEKVKLFLGRGNIGSYHSYNFVLDEIPTEIELIEPNINIVEATNNSYNVEVDEEHDLYILRYIYKVTETNWISWYIFQPSSDRLNTTLPISSDELLSVSESINDHFADPFFFNVRAYDILDDELFRQEYNEFGVTYSINCAEYRTRQVGVHVN